MSATPRLNLVLLVAGQAQAEVTLNDLINRIDAFTNITVKNITTTAPPGSPSNGDCYYVASSPSGAWTGKAGQLAAYYDGWIFQPMLPGMIVWDAGAAILKMWNGTAWHTITQS